jgi:DNA invertase Pin-like site-specific DNA recombinase
VISPIFEMESAAMSKVLPPQTSPELARAAEYVRMSTEHQQYSTENQGSIIRKYAEQKGMKIIRTYTDSGKSGLRLDGRNGLKQLIHDV